MMSVSAVSSNTIAQMLAAINNPQPTNLNIGTPNNNVASSSSSSVSVGSSVASGSGSIDVMA